MKKILILMAIGCGAAIVQAGHGYCYECGCNRFTRDYYRGNSDNWYCRCGHRYEDHLHGNRPSSYRDAGWNHSIGLWLMTNWFALP